MNNPGAPVILITGGAGFLGRALVREFLAPDAPVRPRELRVFDIAPFPEPTGSALSVIQGNIFNYEEVSAACRGADLVIHAAAIVDWGTKSEAEVYATNVTGTEHVVRACREQGVRHLIYTSSLDAVFAGSPLVNVDETLSYPSRHPNMYCRSKYLGEEFVLKANGNDLGTCALRPADIYGEADPYHIDSLVNMAKTGFYVRLGDGSARSQHVYVGNMAYAHVLAAKGLLDGNESLRGQVYFITDGEPHNFFTFFDRIVFGAGYRVWPRNLWLPRRLAYGIGAVSEAIAVALRPIQHYHPKFSRFAVLYTCSDFTFSSQKAERHFGFKPKYSQEEALERTIEFYRRKRTKGE